MMEDKTACRPLRVPVETLRSFVEHLRCNTLHLHPEIGKFQKLVFTDKPPEPGAWCGISTREQLLAYAESLLKEHEGDRVEAAPESETVLDIRVTCRGPAAQSLLASLQRALVSEAAR